MYSGYMVKKGMAQKRKPLVSIAKVKNMIA